MKCDGLADFTGATATRTNCGWAEKAGLFATAITFRTSVFAGLDAAKSLQIASTMVGRIFRAQARCTAVRAFVRCHPCHLLPQVCDNEQNLTDYSTGFMAVQA